MILPVVVSLHALEPREDRLEPSICVSHQRAKAPNQGEVASGIAIEQIVGLVEQEHDPHVRILGQTGRNAVGHLFNQSDIPVEDLLRKLRNGGAADEFIVHAAPEYRHHRFVPFGIGAQVIHIEVDHVDRVLGSMMLTEDMSQQGGLSKLTPTEDDTAPVLVYQGRRLGAPPYEHLGGDVFSLCDVRTCPSERESQLEQHRQTVAFPAQVEKEHGVKGEDRELSAREVTLPPDPVRRCVRKQEKRDDGIALQTASADVLLELLRLLPGLGNDDLVATSTRGPKGWEW